MHLKERMTVAGVLKKNLVPPRGLTATRADTLLTSTSAAATARRERLLLHALMRISIPRQRMAASLHGFGKGGCEAIAFQLLPKTFNEMVHDSRHEEAKERARLQAKSTEQNVKKGYAEMLKDPDLRAVLALVSG